MKRLISVLAIIALIAICISDVTEHGNGAIFTGCVILGMAFVALGCMAIEIVNTVVGVKEDECDNK